MKKVALGGIRVLETGSRVRKISCYACIELAEATSSVQAQQLILLTRLPVSNTLLPYSALHNFFHRV